MYNPNKFRLFRVPSLIVCMSAICDRCELIMLVLNFIISAKAKGKMTTICKQCLLWCFTLMVTLLSGITTMPVSVLDTLCTAPSTAKYRLTFTGKWSQTAFPKQYPVYRPPAQWSPLIGEWNTQNTKEL